MSIPTWAFYDNANELVNVLRKREQHEWANQVERFSRSYILEKDYFCAGYVVYLDADDRVIKIEAIVLTGALKPRPIIEIVDIRNWHAIRSVDLNEA
jgi:hypothetical protein